MKQSKFDSLCQAERGWAFERVVGGLLEGFNHKEVNSWTPGSVMCHACSVMCHIVSCVMFQVNNIETRAECARLCLLEEEFPCRWAESHF